MEVDDIQLMHLRNLRPLMPTLQPIGSDILVSELNFEPKEINSVTALADGSYLVLWHAFDADSTGVFGRILSGSGDSLSDEFAINSVTTGHQGAVVATAHADGGFAVVWQSNLRDANGYDIVSRRFFADASPVGVEASVNTSTALEPVYPKISSMEDGGYVILWDDSGNVVGRR